MYWSTWSSVTGDLALSLTEVLGEAGVKFQVELNTCGTKRSLQCISVIPASWDSFTLTCKFPHSSPVRFGYSKQCNLKIFSEQ